MSLITKFNFFDFILKLSKKYNIDESHSIKHSMDVFHYANKIYQNEKEKHDYLNTHVNIIYASALLHDMCDKKYIDEKEGIKEIDFFLQDKLSSNEIEITKQIISRMSYSTVKKLGYPNLGEYQLAYHIVREADLLAAYDFDRCLIYTIHHNNNNNKNNNFESVYQDSIKLFEDRIFNYISDNLFITNYSKTLAYNLQLNSISRINSWKNIIDE